MAGNDDRIEYLMADAADARDQMGEAIDTFDRAELDDLRLLLADPTLWDEPSDGLGDAVVAGISAAAARGEAAPSTAADAAPAHTPAPPASSTRASGRAGRRFRSAYLFGSAALGAAAAALVAFAVVNIGDDNSSRPSADAQITLVGTDLLPEAGGRADITTTPSGVQIQLDVPDLPRRDGNEFYEAWLKNDDGTGLIPIGTFHSGEDVTLWAGVAIEDYPILTVTRETVAAPKDPGQGSSGEVVVSGRLNS